MAKILFGIMSAVAKESTVAQLCKQLSPHQVVIHHDFSQKPDFQINQPHVSFVPNPRRTGYGSWVFPAGILHLMRYCVEHFDFDYFQLLSPSCLPIKPLKDFAQHVASSDVDLHLDFLDVSEQENMVHFGPRLFAPAHSARRVILKKAKEWYSGKEANGPVTEERGGLQVFAARRNPDGSLPLLGRLGVAVMEIGRRPPFAISPPIPNPKRSIGGHWIGAKKAVCEHVVNTAANPDWLRYFERLNDIGEVFLQTILANTDFKSGPANHYVSPYHGWHPRTLTVDDIDTLAGSRCFFARKFIDDPDADVRRIVIERLAKSRL
jgi:hypothetical protein